MTLDFAAHGQQHSDEAARTCDDRPRHQPAGLLFVDSDQGISLFADCAGEPLLTSSWEAVGIWPDS